MPHSNLATPSILAGKNEKFSGMRLTAHWLAISLNLSLPVSLQSINNLDAIHNILPSSIKEWHMRKFSVWLALVLVALPSMAHALDLRGDSTTILRLEQRDNPGFAKKDVYPATEFFRADLGNLGNDALSFHTAGWGRLDLADPGSPCLRSSARRPGSKKPTTVQTPWLADGPVIASRRFLKSGYRRFTKIMLRPARLLIRPTIGGFLAGISGLSLAKHSNSAAIPITTMPPAVWQSTVIARHLPRLEV